MEKSLSIKQNTSLKLLNTFGIEAQAQYFAFVHTPQQLIELISNNKLRGLPKLILGDGSNVLFTKNYQGLVIKNAIKGISLLKEDDQYAWVEVGAGENWHDFVMYCVNKGYGGLENLSLIPGTVGAAPIQNIGAYGVELKDCFFQLEAVSLRDGSIHIFTHQQCQFGYRDSIFKNSHKQQFAITSVVFQLNKQPKFYTDYHSLKEALERLSPSSLNIRMISDAVIHIRQSKLPDPKKIGNAGSFFKNPIISHAQFTELQKKYTHLPHFIQNDHSIKINAAWLIEQCGWKGKRIGHVGVYDKQSLVIVNYGTENSAEILDLASKIQASVDQEFGIRLEAEVQLI